MDCPICCLPLLSTRSVADRLLSSRSNTSVSALTCGHCFHKNCLKLALEYKRQCPTCRAKVKSEEPHPLYLHAQCTTESDVDKWKTVLEGMPLFGPKNNKGYSTCLFVHGDSDPSLESISGDCKEPSASEDPEIVDENPMASCSREEYDSVMKEPSKTIPIIVQALYESKCAHMRQRKQLSRLQREMHKLCERNTELFAKHNESKRQAASLHDQLHSHVNQEKKIQEMNNALVDGMAGYSHSMKSSTNEARFSDRIDTPALEVLGTAAAHKQVRKTTPDIVECSPLERAIDRTKQLVCSLRRDLDSSKNECSKLLLESVSLRRKLEKYRRHYADRSSSRVQVTENENGEMNHHTNPDQAADVPESAPQYYPQMTSRPGKANAVGNEVRFISKRLRGHSGDKSSRQAIQEWVTNVTPYCPDFQIDP